MAVASKVLVTAINVTLLPPAFDMRVRISETRSLIASKFGELYVGTDTQRLLQKRWQVVVVIVDQRIRTAK
jgi:hypothetical protein